MPGERVPDLETMIIGTGQDPATVGGHGDGEDVMLQIA